jgi:hypothetical protein
MFYCYQAKRGHKIIFTAAILSRCDDFNSGKKLNCDLLDVNIVTFGRGFTALLGVSLSLGRWLTQLTEVVVPLP